MAIYNNEMYFGNRNYMQWVPAPQINYESSKRGFAATAGYLNGGQFVRRSATGAKGYVLTWTLKSRDDIRAINDYADGVYGFGPTYFLDPFAMDKNLLPQYFATPALASADAPLLAGQYDEDRPSVLQTDPNNLGYPALTATYQYDGSNPFNQVWIPIPFGFSLWVGAHGSATGTAGVQVTPTTGPFTGGLPIAVPLRTVQDPVRVDTRVNGNTYGGALIQLKGAGTIRLSGVMAQVLPNGSLPQQGGFISGQGNSGCSFVEEPTLTNYSAAIDKVGIAVNLVETEGWK